MFRNTYVVLSDVSYSGNFVSAGKVIGFGDYKDVLKYFQGQQMFDLTCTQVDPLYSGWYIQRTGNCTGYEDLFVVNDVNRSWDDICDCYRDIYVAMADSILNDKEQFVSGIVKYFGIADQTMICSLMYGLRDTITNPDVLCNFDVGIINVG